MARYKRYENLPWWLNNLNDNTLTPAQKEVLGLDYHCRRHGNKLSHQRAAARLDISRRTVIRARNRLEYLLLRESDVVAGSTRIGHPIEYAGSADWAAQLKARGVSLGGDKMSPKSSRERPPQGGLSLSKGKKVASAEAPEAGVFLPQTPAGLTDRCSGGMVEPSANRKVRDQLLWKVIYRDSLRRNLDVPYPQEQAERLARIRANHKVAKRRAEREKSLVQRKSDHKNH